MRRWFIAIYCASQAKKCDHKRLINNKIRVIDKVYHIQAVSGPIAHFKDWINGEMKGVATKYLSNYLAWFKESKARYTENISSH